MTSSNEVLFQAAVDATQGVQATREPKQVRVRALIGDGNGTVDSPQGVPWVIARLYGDASRQVQAYNGTGIDPAEGMSVLLLLRYQEGRATHYEVERLSNDVPYPGYNPSPSGGVPAHAPSHEFRAGGGWDAVNVYERAITSLRVNAQTTPDLTVQVAQGYYSLDGQLYFFIGGNSIAFTPPGSGSRYDVLTLDSGGNLFIEVGALSVPPVFTLTTGRLPLVAVRLIAGQTSVTEDDLFDVRPFLSEMDRGAYIRADGSISFTHDESMGGHSLTDVADPVNPQDVATMAYVEARRGSGSSPHALLDGTQNNDTAANPPLKGALIAGNGTPKWSRVTVGADGTFLKADAASTAGVKWDTVTGSVSPVISAASLVYANQTFI